MFYFIG